MAIDLANMGLEARTARSFERSENMNRDTMSFFLSLMAAPLRVAAIAHPEKRWRS